MNKSKLWGLSCLALTLTLLIMVTVVTAVIDPFFHYHAPQKDLQYPLNSQRYQNDGIVRNFTYNALITGTSMTENFKTSEFDALFGVHSIKVTYSGGTYEEITSNLRQALEHNPHIRYVIYGLDEWFLFYSKDLILADGKYPTYLYDDNLFNDVQYLLNKSVLCDNTLEVLRYTAAGNTTTSFDDYSSWEFETGPQVVIPNYKRVEQVDTIAPVTPEMAAQVQEQIEHNLLSLARKYPDTQFLYFFPPYSILNWDAHQREGILNRTVEGMRLTSELLMTEPNIQVYSFSTDYDTITNLDNYRDIVHYDADINSLLLQRMARQEYRLTPETNDAHWQEVLEYYSHYDYDALFSQ